MDKKVLSLIIVLSGMVAGAILVANQQNINEQASSFENVGQIVINPVESSQNPDSLERIEISFSTGEQDGQMIEISSISLRLKYPGDVTAEIQSSEDGPFKRDDSLGDDWKFSVNEIYLEEGVTYLDVAAVYATTRGYSTQSQDLAYLEFVGDQFTLEDYAVLGWDDEHVKIMTKESPVENILSSVEKN